MAGSRRFVARLVVTLWLTLGATQCRSQTADEILSKMVAATQADLDNVKIWRFSGSFDVEGIGEHAGRKFGSNFECITDGVSFLNRSTFDPVRTTERRSYQQVNSLFTPEALFVTRFSPRIKPIGCETRIHKASTARVSDSTEASIKWCPWKLCVAVLDPRIAFDTRAIDSTLPSGEIRLRLGRKEETADMSYLVGVEPRFGHRIVSMDMAWGGKVYQTSKLEWQEKDSQWFIKSIVMEEPIMGQRTRLVVNEIDLKPSLSDATFSMESLGMLPESRIIDERTAPSLEGKAPRKDEKPPQKASDLQLKPIR